MNPYPKLREDEDMLIETDSPIPNDECITWSSSESDSSESKSYKLKYYEVNELSQNKTNSGGNAEKTEHQTKEDMQTTRVPRYCMFPMWKLKICWLTTFSLFITVVVTLLVTYFTYNKPVSPALDPTPVSAGTTLYQVFDRRGGLVPNCNGWFLNLDQFKNHNSDCFD